MGLRQHYALLVVSVVFLSACSFPVAEKCNSISSSDLKIGDQPIVISTANLASTTEGISDTCALESTEALASVQKSARRQLRSPILTVMDKLQTGPSGSKHDYTTLSRYFWPDPSKADGLPYIRVDGQVNPYSEGENYDKPALVAFQNAMLYLSAGYYYSHKVAMAERAVAWLRAWFLDPATKMNPNLQYSAIVLGDTANFGLIEFAVVPHILDAINITYKAGGMTDAELAQVKNWFQDYYTWMLGNASAQLDKNATNNHAVYYEVQVASIALFLGLTSDVVASVNRVKNSIIPNQILPSGEQPNEATRTAAFKYSCYNLKGLMHMASIASKVGIDLWSYETVDGRGIRAVLEYLRAFALETTPWTGNGALEQEYMIEPLWRAGVAYSSADYQRDALAIRDGEGIGASTKALIKAMYGYAP